MKISRQLCKNFDNRNCKPAIVVIHITDDLSVNRVLNTFNNPNEAKSAHYLVLENGDILQLVEESKRAWTNGLKVNPSSELVIVRKENPNEYTIAIEVMGIARKEINLLQYESLMNLVKDICQRNTIPINRKHIIGHREIRADKSCPALISVDRIVYEVGRAIEMENGAIIVKIELLERYLELLKVYLSLLLQKIKLGGKIGDSCGGGRNA